MGTYGWGRERTIRGGYRRAAANVRGCASTAASVHADCGRLEGGAAADTPGGTRPYIMPFSSCGTRRGALSTRGDEFEWRTAGCNRALVRRRVVVAYFLRVWRYV
jgi:hypothetical protein